MSENGRQNVFLTTLSLLRKSGINHAVWENEVSKPIHYYIQQRPGFEFSHNALVSKGKSNKFDKIIVLCSNEVLHPTGDNKDSFENGKRDLWNGLDKQIEATNTYEVFKFQVIHNITYDIEGKNPKELPRKNGVVYREEDFSCFEVRDSSNVDYTKLFAEIGEDSDIYIDTQGGSRTTNLVIQAIISIAVKGISTKRQGLKGLVVKSIVAGEGDRPNFRYKSVKEEYTIMDLVAGMNAFIENGKANIIYNYVDQLSVKDKVITDLVDKMKKVDDAMAICDVLNIKKGMKDLWEYIQRKESLFKSPFDYLAIKIKKDYASFINNDDVDILLLIDWSVKKKMYQQALTLAEALIPSIIEKSNRLVFSENLDRYNIRDYHDYLGELQYYYLPQEKDLGYERYKVTLAFDGEKIVQADGVYFKLSEKIKSKTLMDLLMAYRFVKDARNNINHASENVKEELFRKLAMDKELEDKYYRDKIDNQARARYGYLQNKVVNLEPSKLKITSDSSIEELIINLLTNMKSACNIFCEDRK